MGRKNPPLLCTNTCESGKSSFRFRALLRIFGTWRFKPGGGDAPMALWQICSTRARPALLKVTLLHIWNWVSCLHFCEVKSGLNILIFHQNISCLPPNHGVSICRALHLTEWYLPFIFDFFPCWFSFQNQISGGKISSTCDMSGGEFPWGFPAPSFAPQQKIVQFCFFLNYLWDLQPSPVL